MKSYKEKRQFVEKDFEVSNWDSLKPYFDKLIAYTIESTTDLEKWIKNWSELEAILEEDMAWRYIKMNLDTTDENLKNDFLYFVENIEPKLSPINDELNKKFIKYYTKFPINTSAFKIHSKSVKNAIELFREENIPIQTKLSQLEQEYGAINSQMTLEHDGEEITLQKAATFLKSKDRDLRKTIFEKINNRRIQDKGKLDDLLFELIQLRQQLATNAGFDNYRDYKFKEMNRFDYEPKDCFKFHDSVKESVLPVLKEINEERRKSLKLDKLYPYDLNVDIKHREPLKPFTTGDELLEKTILCFDKIDPYFSKCLKTMKAGGFLDLESRKGKAPGGFNYPLYECNIPFIFMNAVGSQSDLVTMVHEGGHAIHSFLTADLDYTFQKSFPSEVAELASMTMELISMDHWDIFYENEEDLRRAKIDQIERAIDVLPWVAIVDKFQHQLYEKIDLKKTDIDEIWIAIFEDISTDDIAWDEYFSYKKNAWQKQLHIFEVPFYYIEYGMAQLGAIAIWRNYKNDSQKTLSQFKSALKLGYTENILEVYKTAGIEFSFDENYIRELLSFLLQELKKLKLIKIT